MTKRCNSAGTRIKICVATGTRAEYGLLYWLMREIEADKDLELQLVATGMHLSPEFGLTYKEIEKEFKIDKKIEMLYIVVVLGDRYEIFSAASAAMIGARIPIAHLHGGETVEGAFDESIRHSITKMSHFYFTATEEYKKAQTIQKG